MKTAEEYWNSYHIKLMNGELMTYITFLATITERDKEWTQKIQDALDKETNWDFQVKLKELLK